MDSTNNPAGARVLVGRYRLGERIGRGGMGDVYRATDQVLARQVAVKLSGPTSATRRWTSGMRARPVSSPG